MKNLYCYKPLNEVSPEDEVLSISGTRLREMLLNGAEIPDWFTFPEVAKLLKKSAAKDGIVFFLTGFSGAGKSTIAKRLAHELTIKMQRPVSLIDGDEIRNYISPDLGFSKNARSLNVRRVGYIASEIAKHGGIAICSMIAPYREDRNYNRKLISQFGKFIEVHIATPLSICEERDTKGLYQKAREGIIKEFTGISDPYEDPENPEIYIDTTGKSIQQCVERIAIATAKQNVIICS